MNDFKLGMTIGTIIGVCGTLILLFLQGEISVDCFLVTIATINLTFIGTIFILDRISDKKPN